MAHLPKPPVRNAKRFAPIFVVSTARSYSSVITTMIGQHPDLAGFPELKLFCCGTLAELEDSLPRYWLERGVTHRSPGLVRAVAEFEFGGQTLESLSRARAWLRDRRDWPGADIFDVLLERVSPRSAVEKSPDNILDDEGLQTMAAAYPQARYLHLTRHPVSTQRSIQEYRGRIDTSHRLSGEPMSGIAAWYEVHRRILLFAGSLPANRYLRVRAEDILNDMQSQLLAIVSWLGIRADEDSLQAMQHPEASPFAKPGPAGSGVVGGNDPGFLHDPIPRKVAMPGNLDPPSGWVADSSIWRMVADLAKRLGYD